MAWASGLKHKCQNPSRPFSLGFWIFFGTVRMDIIFEMLCLHMVGAPQTLEHNPSLGDARYFRQVGAVPKTALACFGSLWYVDHRYLRTKG